VGKYICPHLSKTLVGLRCGRLIMRASFQVIGYISCSDHNSRKKSSGNIKIVCRFRMNNNSHHFQCEKVKGHDYQADYTTAETESV